jgi:hypothetical protein
MRQGSESATSEKEAEPAVFRLRCLSACAPLGECVDLGNGHAGSLGSHWTHQAVTAAGRAHFLSTRPPVPLVARVLSCAVRVCVCESGAFCAAPAALAGLQPALDRVAARRHGHTHTGRGDRQDEGGRGRVCRAMGASGVQSRTHWSLPFFTPLVPSEPVWSDVTRHLSTSANEDGEETGTVRQVRHGKD